MLAQLERAAGAAADARAHAAGQHRPRRNEEILRSDPLPLRDGLAVTHSLVSSWRELCSAVASATAFKAAAPPPHSRGWNARAWRLIHPILATSITPAHSESTSVRQSGGCSSDEGKGLKTVAI